MFSTNVRGGKAFAAEQKIRGLKNRIFRLKSFNKKGKKCIKPINNTDRTNNMNETLTEKYRVEPETVEKGNCV